MNAERAAALTLGDRRREAAAILEAVELQPHLGVSATAPTHWSAGVALDGHHWRSRVSKTPQAAIADLAVTLRELGADEADL